MFAPSTQTLSGMAMCLCDEHHMRSGLRELRVPDSAHPPSKTHVFTQEGSFAAAICCTSDPAQVDKRPRSKWSRLMRYAAEHKLSSQPLDRFVWRKGGVNKCAARCLGVWSGGTATSFETRSGERLPSRPLSEAREIL